MQPIRSTEELQGILVAAAKSRRAFNDEQHPARRVFQALRIAVNDELDALRQVWGGKGNVAMVGAVQVVSMRGLGYTAGCLRTFVPAFLSDCLSATQCWLSWLAGLIDGLVG